MHAHRCQVCADKGENVVWIHGEQCRGVVQSHKCPKCGNTEWKKWLVEVGQLPQQHVPCATAHTIDMFLGYSVILIAVAAIAYSVYLYVKENRGGSPVA